MLTTAGNTTAQPPADMSFDSRVVDEFKRLLKQSSGYDTGPMLPQPRTYQRPKQHVVSPEHVWDQLQRKSQDCISSGQFDEACRLLERSVCIAEQISQRDERIWQSLDFLTQLAFKTGEFDKAKQSCLKQLSFCESLYGPAHPQTADCLTNLAGICYMQRNYLEAEPYAVRALKIYNKFLGSEHHKIGTASTNLGMVYQAQGKYSLARMIYERAVPIQQRHLGKDHPAVKNLVADYAMVLTLVGQEAEARSIRSQYNTSGEWRVFDGFDPHTCEAS